MPFTSICDRLVLGHTGRNFTLQRGTYYTAFGNDQKSLDSKTFFILCDFYYLQVISYRYSVPNKYSKVEFPL